jgi:hypothetical protein
VGKRGGVAYVNFEPDDDYDPSAETREDVSVWYFRCRRCAREIEFARVLAIIPCEAETDDMGDVAALDVRYVCECSEPAWTRSIVSRHPGALARLTWPHSPLLPYCAVGPLPPLPDPLESEVKRFARRLQRLRSVSQWLLTIRRAQRDEDAQNGE